ncbi:hypothetical protein R3W88_031832 [Solanum pinnatisectum]|uniref:Ubiquitin-like protease family profile domain-containing protein n=1 Tax=Solanum pinnatisectum TaxID=50273 RepID=A0AAV9LQ40_9SOLN|nr:hypothetical protein R3W88_031832 [Solanum pinnatisectum]
MIQEPSSMITSQSFIGVASSSNIKCSFCLCEEYEQQHDYFISRVKEFTDIFKEMTYNIDVHTSKKISQPLKCRRLKKSISQSLSIISFNIDGEGPTELMSSFSQWINEGLYKHHAKNAVPEYENKIIGTIKGFGILARLPWHLIDEVYVPVNCNGEFHKVLAVIALKELRIKGKNKSHPFEVIHVTGIAQQASNSLDCGIFVVAYAEFLSGLQIPSEGIISQSLCLRYASLLWNYGILKARSGYVSNNKDPQNPRPKKAKFIDENVVVTTID